VPYSEGAGAALTQSTSLNEETTIELELMSLIEEYRSQSLQVTQLIPLVYDVFLLLQRVFIGF